MDQQWASTGIDDVAKKPGSNQTTTPKPDKTMVAAGHSGEFGGFSFFDGLASAIIAVEPDYQPNRNARICQQ